MPTSRSQPGQTPATSSDKQLSTRTSSTFRAAKTRVGTAGWAGPVSLARSAWPRRRTEAVHSQVEWACGRHKPPATPSQADKGRVCGGARVRSCCTSDGSLRTRALNSITPAFDGGASPRQPGTPRTSQRRRPVARTRLASVWFATDFSQSPLDCVFGAGVPGSSRLAGPSTGASTRHRGVLKWPHGQDRPKQGRGRPA